MRTKGSPDELERKRRHAVELLQQDLGPSEVARRIGASKGAVSRWGKAFREGGGRALAAKPHPGPKSRMTLRQTDRLQKLLLQGAPRHGWVTELWTLPRVAELIRRRFEVDYHPGHVWKLLRRLGWSCQKPTTRARKRDEQAIETWRRVDWPHIKKRST